MRKRPDEAEHWSSLRERIIGLGERSIRKSYYPELRQKLAELERFRTLLDLSRDLVLVIECPSGRIVDVNDAVSQHLDLKREVLLSLVLQDIVPSPLPDVLGELLAGRDGEDGALCAITEFRRRDHSRLPVELTARGAVIDRARYCVLVGRTIEERLKAEQALRESEERFKDFADTAADWFWEMDSDLRFTSISGRFEEISGLTTDRILGKTLQELVLHARPKDIECWEEHFEDLQARRPFRHFEFMLVRPGGMSRIQRSSGKPVYRDGRFQGYRGTARDITREHALAAEISHQATHDELTGLVNRREFQRRLEQALASAREYDAQHALCYLDLDQFKLINDSAGHVAGDELLKQVGNLLLGKVRASDTLARLGGDEFSLLLEHCPLDKAQEIAEGLIAAIKGFCFTWMGRRFSIGVSIGLVPVGANSESAVQLLTQADVACYIAKDLGRNQVHVYQASETGHRHREIHRVAKLRDALDQDRFVLYCQPIVALGEEGREPIRYEVLLRMLNSKDAVLLPASFIPAAERYGLMAAIDRWVIHNALRHFPEVFDDPAGPGIAINLSGNSLSDSGFPAFLQQELATAALAPERICFEITETAAISNLSRVVHLINELKQAGCRFALDDFGSGLCSFTYLKNLPVDFVKIDRSFVRDMVTDPIDHAMVAAIHQVGHIMGIRTIAEGAETEIVIEQLAALGVDYVQGYAIGRPKPLEECNRALLVDSD